VVNVRGGVGFVEFVDFGVKGKSDKDRGVGGEGEMGFRNGAHRRRRPAPSRGVEAPAPQKSRRPSAAPRVDVSPHLPGGPHPPRPAHCGLARLRERKEEERPTPRPTTTRPPAGGATPLNEARPSPPTHRRGPPRRPPLPRS